MAAFDIALADAITELLNDDDRVWSEAFQAERVWVPDWEITTELKALRCAVYPDLRSAERFERSSVRKTTAIGLAFGQHLKLKTREEVDALCNTVEEVTDYLESNPQITLDPPENRAFLFMGWEDRIRADAEHLNRVKQPDGSILYSGVFLAVVSFAYELLPP